LLIHSGLQVSGNPAFAYPDFSNDALTTSTIAPQLSRVTVNFRRLITIGKRIDG